MKLRTSFLLFALLAVGGLDASPLTINVRLSDPGDPWGVPGTVLVGTVGAFVSVCTVTPQRTCSLTFPIEQTPSGGAVVCRNGGTTDECAGVYWREVVIGKEEPKPEKPKRRAVGGKK